MLIDSPVAMTRKLVKAAGLASASESEWTRQYDREGVQVFTRPVAGSAYQEFRGEAIIDADIGPILSMLWTTEDMPYWMEGCLKAELVKSISHCERMIYIVNTTHGLMEPRDIVLHNRIEQDPATLVVRYTMDKVDYPLDTGYIEVAKMNGIVELKPLAPGRTHVVYQAHFDAGGYLPTWLISLAIKKFPAITITAGRRLQQRRRYPDFPGIKNFPR